VTQSVRIYLHQKNNKEAAHVSILTQIVQESIEKLLSLDISEGLGVFLE
jgi:hypothetical protein